MDKTETNTLFDNLNQAFIKFSEVNCILFENISNNQLDHYDFSVFQQAFNESIIQFFSCPEKILEKNISLFNEHFFIAQNISLKLSGMINESLYKPDNKDARFRDKDWEGNVFFNYILQCYLAYSKWFLKIISDTNLPIIDVNKAKFFAKQYLDALSPSNFMYTNPTVMQEIFTSNGKSILQGFENLKRDVIKNKFPYNIPNTVDEIFKIGENLANTKGSVVFRNELFELIHYTPTQDKNDDIPILIVPPCINKYYILDLKPEVSFVKWLLDQNLPVFMVSWINPDENHAHIDMENYVIDGVITAIDFIRDKFKFKSINAMGYCIGGTMLTMAISYLIAHKKSPIKSLTLLATLVDFEEPGDLKMFLDYSQIEKIEDKMKVKGYYDKCDMTAAFTLLRSNEMIWQQFVHNYLLGKAPNAFDLLYWNADGTRIPAKFQSFYLRNMYLENNLVKNNITIAGTTIDITNIDIPVYLLATSEDYIVPWDSCYSAVNIFKNTRFILGGSGHVAGIVNHPSKGKYFYHTNDIAEASADDWLKSSTKHSGSWWNDWLIWQRQYSGSSKKSVTIKDMKIKAIQAAPGSYVLDK